MAWLEITIDTAAEKINSVVTVLTAKGFADLKNLKLSWRKTRPIGTILTKNFRKSSRAFPTLSCIWKIRTRQAWNVLTRLSPN